MKRVLFLASVLSLLFVVSGCDVDVEGDEPGECSDGTDNDQDGTADCDDSGCAVDAACTGDDDDDDDDDDDGPCDEVEPGPGSLEGTVVRAAEATDDGVGTLVLYVFDLDPFQNVDACEVANSVVPGLDLSGDGNGFGYTIVGIPTRAEPYFVMALFDDNGDFDETGEPGPGDLLSFAEDSTVVPTVVVTDASPVQLDLQLNFVFGGDSGGDDDDSGGDDDDSGGDDDDSSGPGN